jgi:hypothetical protein
MGVPVQITCEDTVWLPGAPTAGMSRRACSNAVQLAVD